MWVLQSLPHQQRHTSFRMASMFLSVSEGMHKSKGEGKVQVCQRINSRHAGHTIVVKS